jgi:hypothetical protein
MFHVFTPLTTLFLLNKKPPVWRLVYLFSYRLLHNHAELAAILAVGKPILLGLRNTHNQNMLQPY